MEDIDALRQAHEKLKRKSQRQRDRIKGLEGWVKKYGKHDPELCLKGSGWVNELCECGLDGILTPKEK